MKDVRQMFLDRETESLSKYAFRTSDTRGRDNPCVPDNVRTEFQRDRDRIIHSKSFRRLMHKTQVFFSPKDEHYRTRMTHTLEVTQIARIMARGLMLNEDLTEAAALGHDLGHTPFGHAGEEAMRKCFDPKFAHYKQSIRVVDILENNGEGLNLTYEVKDAILNHTGSNMASTLEGVLVKFADRIAYINHDIDDAIRAGILSDNDIPKYIRETLGDTHSKRINTLVLSVIDNSFDKPTIQMSDEVGEAMTELRSFLFRNVYEDSAAKAEESKAQNMLISLFEYYSENPHDMPSLYHDRISVDGVGRCVCDYISGMTDRFAIDTFCRLFVPKGWEV
ncbi:MAG: deoxyguanosinetriphosphate triphosphohydrolase [Eubacteriales bacterium]|nr:deoxyguanosinetriphosphate triphosphohydrolase [Eubacteriales bacterium]